MRFVLGLAVSVLTVGQACAQAGDRQFSVTLTETQWNTVGDIVSDSKESWRKTNPIMQAIGAQIGQGLQLDAQARQRGIEAEAQAKKATAEADQLKAEIERLKGELAKLTPAPEPEKP